MTCSRWIRVCVDMLDHPVVGANVPPPKPHDPSRHAIQPALAWLDMISAAAWKTREVPHKDKVITLQRGEFLAGRAYWAKRWNWGEQAVRSFFSRLVKFEMIAISNQSLGHTSNVVSICNYDVYQGAGVDSQPEEKPEVNQCPTSAQPVPNQTVYRDTKDRNKNPPTPLAGGPTPLEALEAFELYNATALRCGLPQASKLTPERQRKIRARLKDFGLDGWKQALANIEKSAFLTGGTDKGFRADLDFVVQAKSFGKLHDGGYGNGRHAEPKPKIEYLDADWIHEARANMDY